MGAQVEAAAVWQQMMGGSDPLEDALAVPLQPSAGLVEVRLPSANVLTLRPAEEAKAGFTTRRLQLESLFAEARASDVGIQEGRSRAAFARKSRVFFLARFRCRCSRILRYGVVGLLPDRVSC